MNNAIAIEFAKKYFEENGSGLWKLYSDPKTKTFYGIGIHPEEEDNVIVFSDTFKIISDITKVQKVKEELKNMEIIFFSTNS